MRYQRLTLTAAGVAAAALMLTACNGADSSPSGSASGSKSASGHKSASGSKSATGSAAGAKPGAGSGAASPSSDQAGDAKVGSAAAAARNTGGAAPASARRCHTRDLSLQVIMGAQQDPSANGGKGDFSIQLTNTSSRTCTLAGYAGVELLDMNTGKPLGMKDARSAKLAMGKGTKQKLAPNDASAADIVFPTREPGGTAGLPRASKVQVIPPNETQPLTAPITDLYAKGGKSAIMIDGKTLKVGPMGVDGVPHR
jgi:hypothetical protein